MRVTTLIFSLLLTVMNLTACSNKPAPDVKLQLLNQQTLDLASLRGKPVVITFWATSCPGCVAEIPLLSQLHQRLAASGVKIIGVAMSYDPQQQVAQLVKKMAIPYAIAIDTSAEVSRAFGDIRLTPTTFVIDPQGNIAFQKIGDVDFVKLEADLRAMLGKTGGN